MTITKFISKCSSKLQKIQISQFKTLTISSIITQLISGRALYSTIDLSCRTPRLSSLRRLLTLVRIAIHMSADTSVADSSQLSSVFRSVYVRCRLQSTIRIFLRVHNSPLPVRKFNFEFRNFHCYEISIDTSTSTDFKRNHRPRNKTFETHKNRNVERRTISPGSGMVRPIPWSGALYTFGWCNNATTTKMMIAAGFSYSFSWFQCSRTLTSQTKCRAAIITLPRSINPGTCSRPSLHPDFAYRDSITVVSSWLCDAEV